MLAYASLKTSSCISDRWLSTLTVWVVFQCCKMRFPGLHQQSSWLIAFSSKCRQILMLLQQHMLYVQQAPALYWRDCFIPIAQLQNLQYCWSINNSTLVPVSTIVSGCCRRLRLHICEKQGCSRSITNSCTTAAQLTSRSAVLLPSRACRAVSWSTVIRQWVPGSTSVCQPSVLPCPHFAITEQA